MVYHACWLTRMTDTLIIHFIYTCVLTSYAKMAAVIGAY